MFVIVCRFAVVVVLLLFLVVVVVVCGVCVCVRLCVCVLLLLLFYHTEQVLAHITHFFSRAVSIDTTQAALCRLVG